MTEKIPAVPHINDLAQWYPEFALKPRKLTASEAMLKRWQLAGAIYERRTDVTDSEQKAQENTK